MPRPAFRHFGGLAKAGYHVVLNQESQQRWAALARQLPKVGDLLQLLQVRPETNGGNVKRWMPGAWKWPLFAWAASAGESAVIVSMGVWVTAVIGVQMVKLKVEAVTAQSEMRRSTRCCLKRWSCSLTTSGMAMEWHNIDILQASGAEEELNYRNQLAALPGFQVRAWFPPKVTSFAAPRSNLDHLRSVCR